MTIIMKGIRFEVNMQRATQAYEWKRAGFKYLEYVF